MRNGRRVRLMLAAGAITLIGATACSQAPVCKVSPVELEELREDISVLEADLKKARDREAQLTADLATKKADLETKKGKPAELRARLEEIKKGSGRTEKPKTDPKEPAKKGSS